jgi:TonB family protein
MRNIPAATITMTLVPSTSFRGSSYFLLDDPQVQVRSDGLFEFPRVPPGLYTVRTTPQWPVSPGAITVSDRNLTNLGLATSAAKEISGRVQLVSPPAEEIPLLFDLKGSGGTYRVSATMRLDGTFKTSFPEGEYHVSLITRGGLRPREMTYGGVNLMRERIKLRVNDRVEELRIRLTVPVTRVTGESALTSRCVSCPAPQFPSLASAARVTDTVKVSIVVGKDGTVTDASIISGHQLLRQAALDTVRKWRFLPETGNGAISIFFAYE